MLVSLEWLNEYIDLSDVTPEQIAHELTMSGLEVEEIEKIGAKFTNIVTAKILKLESHPNADKLQLATIFNGKEEKTVVCGAKNIAEGQIIPYASVGSKVLDRKSGEQFELKPAKIRDVESQGMLCSADELGLDALNYGQDEDGILILNRFLGDDIELGCDVKDVLNIKEDIVFDVAPTANRGDLMSVVGVARELSSLFNKPLNFSYIQNTNEPKDSDFEVEIKDEDTCKYYAIAVLKDLKVGKSPEWLSRRLEASGVRSISNIVDITNYVMLEYGQPLHAFDFDKLDNYLCVRRAKESEKLITLDDIERSLSNDSVLIADKDKGVCLAGVMGGNNSEIDDNTVNLALESAYFCPATTRRSSRSVGLRSDACARFERGVDIEATKPALYRAIQLAVELCDAKFESISETGNDKLEDIEITLRFNQIQRVLGIEIPSSKCIQILEKLGFELLGQNIAAAKFLVPSYRACDVTREIDLIEEISRIYGFDKIESTLPKKTQAPFISAETKMLKEINNMFVGKGFCEIMTSSIIGEPLLNWIGMGYEENQAVKVSNPQSEEHTMLRQNIIPNVMQVVKHNLDNAQKNLWLYEIGKTYFFNSEATIKDSGVQEKRILAGAISGGLNLNKWNSNEEVDFYTLKGIIENVLSMFKLENRVQYKSLEDVDYLHPGRSAEVLLMAKKPIQIARLGELHPQVRKKCKINQPVFVFEIDLEELLKNLPKSVVKFKNLPQFPQVERDIAFIIPDSISHQDIAKNIKKFASNNLFKGADIFDVYQGENIEEGFKNLAYRIYLQDVNATLTDEIVDKEISNIKEGLKKTYVQASFRE